MFRGKSIEELEDLEQELLENEEDQQKHGYYSQLVRLYEAMHREVRLRARKSPAEYEHYLHYIENKLLTNLIQYGTFLKITLEKSDDEAKHALEKALTYDKTNPIAQYRLGFIEYKMINYSKAISYFEGAIEHQSHYENKKWLLTPQQMYRAHLYLSNSALYIAEKVKKSLTTLPDADTHERLPNYELSPLYGLLTQNEKYLARHAFEKRTNELTTTCSKEECDEIYEEKSLKDCIILYLTDREYCLRFNEKRGVIHPNYAGLLRDFLLKSSKTTSLTGEDLIDHFQRTDVSNDLYGQKIRRLRSKLNEFGIPNINENDGVHRERAYYYNESLPFIMMQRVEEYID